MRKRLPTPFLLSMMCSPNYDHRETIDREIAEHEVLDPGLHAKSTR
jgi:hypothetical protein